MVEVSKRLEVENFESRNWTLGYNTRQIYQDNIDTQSYLDIFDEHAVK